VLLNVAYYLLVFVFGAAIGSFLNVVTQRAPKGRSLGGRSHCPHCSHQLEPTDLVPVLSYVCLGGRCRYCHAKISPRYLVLELVTGILFAATAYFFPVADVASGISLLRALFIIAILVLTFVIDLEHYIIVDSIVLVSCVVLALFAVATPSLLVPSLIAAAGAFAFFLLLHLVGRGRYLGFGDVKLGIFLGLATPGLLAVANIFLAYLIGAAVAIPLLVLGKKQMASKVPFGTFLAVSTVVTLWFGPQLVAWYLRLIGV
jgi:prepilin signal peptidase PulO-like enzyme (type II secretory pathway)